jgi:hypothetical protein
MNRLVRQIGLVAIFFGLAIVDLSEKIGQSLRIVASFSIPRTMATAFT